MRPVYKHATRIIVWLGPKDGILRRAFTFVHELALLTAGIFSNISNDQPLQHFQNAAY